MSNRKDLRSELAALEKQRGKRYWRSLEELAETPVFQELMRREFPEQASVWPDSLSRRQFLSLMGASLALAGLSGCSVRPAASVDLVPYVHPPEEVVPGRPLFYATAMTTGGAGVGVLVESHMGRPTKIEGNPDHPASHGATSIFGQASILQLYDPDRSQTVTHLGQTRTWDDAIAALRAALEKQTKHGGRGLRLLTETVVSPTLADQLKQLQKKFPEAKWHPYEPINRDNAYRAAKLAFGEYVHPRYDFGKADVVLALDADFLTHDAASLRYAADFMARRRVRTTEKDAARAKMNRLYVVETEVTCTGAKADHRLALRPSEIEAFARELFDQVASGGRFADKETRRQGDKEIGHEKWITAVAKDLQVHRGRCLVVAGHRQPPAVHLLAHALNDRLGNVGQTVFYSEPIEASPIEQTESLHELVRDMEKGQVELLLILGGNPVYSAPPDFHFTQALQKVPLRFHLGLYQDETSRQCHWHLPETHYLEAWGDTRAYDGAVSIVQPLIQPLYHGRSVHEMISLLIDKEPLPGYEIIRGHWRKQHTGDFEKFWQTSVHDGVMTNTAHKPKIVSLRKDWQEHLQASGGRQPPEGSAGRPTSTPGANVPGSPRELEISFQPDPSVYDGRFANNGWLQELPKPITKLTWDNAAIMSSKTAKELGVGLVEYAHGGEHGGYVVNVVELELGGRKVRAPVWIMPGHADGAVTVYLGYGREVAGRVGGKDIHIVGFNAYALRTSDQPWFARGVRVTKTTAQHQLACTQQHHLMENRKPVRAGSIDEYRKHPDFALEREQEEKHEETERGRKALTLYQPFDYEPPKKKWGMAIDLTSCIGCNACVVACQAENNIPVVGKNQVLAGREMHWLRVDRYVSGTAEDPGEFHFQPLPCMHCENAPCEYVCPVDATLHSAEGLNDMIYNRCVGTRFCSNNCPYKVRRFNFFHYADYATESLRQQYNPDVTVRSRGVMEKCTYCVQRIRHAEIDADAENRSIRDGEVLTACQAACPTTAIVFGDLNDPRSVVKRWKESPLNYGLLEDLNTIPRTTYLAALRNPNPELEAD